MGIKQGRLYRPQPPDFFSSPNIIATLDRTNDIVHYRKDMFRICLGLNSVRFTT